MTITIDLTTCSGPLATARRPARSDTTRRSRGIARLLRRIADAAPRTPPTPSESAIRDVADADRYRRH